MKRIFQLIALLLISWSAVSQPSDSGRHITSSYRNTPDSHEQKKQSIFVNTSDTPQNNTISLKFYEYFRQTDSAASLTFKIFSGHPYYGFGKPPAKKFKPKPKTTLSEKEILFYVFLILLLILGIFRTGFSNYYEALFKYFFRTTLKQRQIREQLMKLSFPSLFLNVFFVITGGMYIGFLLKYFEVSENFSLWQLFGFGAGILTVVLLTKFIILHLTGWLFQIQQPVRTYIFIVFIVYKLLGIFLVPFLIFFALSEKKLFPVVMSLSWCMVGGLFFYRYVLAFPVFYKYIKVNLFHFFLYILAFELAPLLIIFKILFLYFS
ncbi:MAG: DUF4271 domain-containing protein [Chitinophagaceae bacterium]|nr:DUF4271 domain-containing protein [Chitinophagaceae bacterium]